MDNPGSIVEITGLSELIATASTQLTQLNDKLPASAHASCSRSNNFKSSLLSF